MVRFSSFFCLLMLAFFFFIHSNISSLYVNSGWLVSKGWSSNSDPAFRSCLSHFRFDEITSCKTCRMQVRYLQTFATVMCWVGRLNLRQIKNYGIKIVDVHAFLAILFTYQVHFQRRTCIVKNFQLTLALF